MTETEFRQAVEAKVFDFGSGGKTVRVEHPLMPGLPILVIIESGKPDFELDAAKERAILTLYDDYLTNPLYWDFI